MVSREVKVNVKGSGIEALKRAVSGLTQQFTRLNSAIKNIKSPYLNTNFASAYSSSAEGMQKLNRITKIQTDSANASAKATKLQSGQFMELYFTILGLTFSMMALAKMFGNVRDSVFSNTLAATGFRGGLAEVKAMMDASIQSMWISIGLNESFQEGTRGITEAITNLVDKFADFLERHKTFAKVLGYLVIVLPIVSGALMILGQVFMVLAGTIKLVSIIFSTSLLTAGIWIFAIIAVVILLMFIWAKWGDQIKEIFTKVGAFAKALIGVFKDDWINALKMIAKAAAYYFTDKVLGTLEKVVSIASILLEKLHVDVSGILSSIKEMRSNIQMVAEENTMTFKARYEAELASMTANDNTSTPTSQVTVENMYINADSSTTLNDLVASMSDEAATAGGTGADII